MNCSENDYSQVHTYNPSKLCNVLFTMELSQLFEANGVNDVIAVACNPGVSATNLKAMMPAAAKTAKRNWFWKLLFNLGEFQPQQKKVLKRGAVDVVRSTGREFKSVDYYWGQVLQALRLSSA
ncbi:hypothetical protein KRP22_001737 [Phytophthora ramorum]|nr:hypothetical protein KRP22_1018 [Phytophthora ramorum]